MSLKFTNIYFENEKAWIISAKIAALLEIGHDYKSYVRLVFSNYLQKEIEVPSFASLKGCRDKLYISPMGRKNFLYSYNLLEGNLSEVKIDGEWKEEDISDNIKFFAAEVIGNEVYFIGKGYPGIICVDTDRACANIYNLNEDLIKECKGTYPGYLASRAALVGRKLYIPICNNRKLYIFDTLEKKGTVKELDKEYVSADFDGKNIWLIPQNSGSVKIWNLDKEIFQDAAGYPEGFMGSDQRHFNMGVYQNGYVWIFPSRSNMIIKINVSTLQMECFKKWDDYKSIKYVNAGIVDKQRIWGLYLPEKRLDIIDTSNGEVESRFIDCPINIDSYVEQVVCQQGGSFVYDEELLTLNHFIERICADTKHLSCAYSNGLCGKRIKAVVLGNK